MNIKLFFIKPQEDTQFSQKVQNLFLFLPDEINENLQKIDLIDTSCKIDCHSHNIQPMQECERDFFSAYPRLIGHALTHINICQQVVLDNLDGCFVFENNIDVSDLINLLISNPDISEESDFINLSVGKDLSCYYLSRLGAKKILKIKQNPAILNLKSYYSEHFDSDSAICRASVFFEFCSNPRVQSNYRLNTLHIKLVKNSFKSIYYPKTLPKKNDFNVEFWKKKPTITACICTYGNYSSCRNTVLSLVQQTMPTKDYKILILDNFPTTNLSESKRQNLRELISLCNLFKHCEYSNCSTEGLSQLRNIGWQKCDTDLIFYIDDDAVANFDILENLANKFVQFPNLGVCGGKVSPKWNAKRPDWLTDDLLKFLSIQLSESKDLLITQDAKEYILGTNMCFRVDVLKANHGFSNLLGRRRDILLGGEEDELISRIQKKYKSLYSADCEVHHIISEERLCKSWFLKRAAWQIITNHFILGESSSDTGALVSFLKKNKKLLFEDEENDTEFKSKLSYVQLLTHYLLS